MSTPETQLPDGWLQLDGPEFDANAVAAAEAVVLADADRFEAMLQALRNNASPAVYLTPVVLAGSGQPLPALAEGDVRWDVAAAPTAAVFQRISQINAQTSQLNADDELDAELAFRVLRFLATRQDELEPLLSAQSHTGFCYPLLRPFLSGDDATVLQVLEFLHDQKLLAERFVTSCHGCNHCSSGYLNFVEVCPDCASADLETDDLVHHFACGHVAPAAHFGAPGESMICPKCDSTLRQLGTDHDKPSVSHGCLACGARFQEPQVSTQCFSCGRSARPEDQLHRRIAAWSVTAFGRYAARHGLDSALHRALGQRLRVMPLEHFRTLLAVEASRIERYKRSESSLLVLSVAGLDALYTEIGQRTREVFSEMASYFDAVLRQSDVISTVGESVFVALLTETGPEGAEVTRRRLAEDIRGLLQESLTADVQVNALVEPITKDISLDAVLEQVTAGDD